MESILSTYAIGSILMIRTSLVATASKWNDLPRFGAKAMSLTGSCTEDRQSVRVQRRDDSLYLYVSYV